MLCALLRRELLELAGGHDGHGVVALLRPVFRRPVLRRLGTVPVHRGVEAERRVELSRGLGVLRLRFVHGVDVTLVSCDSAFSVCIDLCREDFKRKKSEKNNNKGEGKTNGKGKRKRFRGKMKESGKKKEKEERWA